MSTNWKAGDKALCLINFIGRAGRTGVIIPGVDIPTAGTVYLVERVVDFPGETPGLNLASMNARGFSYESDRFRKIVPAGDRATHEQEKLLPHEGFWTARPDL